VLAAGRLWNRLGINLPKRQPKKHRYGTDIHIPGATQPNSAWMYNFVHNRLSNGNALKILCVLDEHIYPMSSIPKPSFNPKLVDGELNPPFQHIDTIFNGKS
jgi:hypothetical protein